MVIEFGKYNGNTDSIDKRDSISNSLGNTNGYSSRVIKISGWNVFFAAGTVTAIGIVTALESVTAMTTVIVIMTIVIITATLIVMAIATIKVIFILFLVTVLAWLIFRCLCINTYEDVNQIS